MSEDKSVYLVHVDDHTEAQYIHGCYTNEEAALQAFRNLLYHKYSADRKTVGDAVKHQWYECKIDELQSDNVWIEKQQLRDESVSDSDFEEDSVPTYLYDIPVEWKESGIITVAATTPEEALRIFEQSQDDMDLPDGNYLDDSFKMSYDRNDVLGQLRDQERTQEKSNEHKVGDFWG